jgi:hypothetical protein
MISKLEPCKILSEEKISLSIVSSVGYGGVTDTLWGRSVVSNSYFETHEKCMRHVPHARHSFIIMIFVSITYFKSLIETFSREVGGNLLRCMHED